MQRRTLMTATLASALPLILGQQAGAQEMDEFSFAPRAKVRDGQIVLWHWFEDSFALS